MASLPSQPAVMPGTIPHRAGVGETKIGPVLPAIALLVGAVTLFSCSDAMSKLLRQSLPPVEIAWLRYVVFVGFAGLIGARGRYAGFWPRRPGLQVIRGLALLGSAIFFIAGLGYLPMAEATAINFVSPAFITALSIPVLGEVVGARRWAAVLAGLAGVLIVVRPGDGTIQAAAVFPLASALCWAVAMVTTRRMSSSDRPETTLFWSAAIGLLVLTAFVPFGFLRPTLAQAGLGLVMGVFASAGQYLVILAYKRAAASVLAPFSYAQLLSSTTLGYLVFAAVPDHTTFLGAGIIVLSGLYTAHRERLRARNS